MFITQARQVLLIHKKTGHGAGVINGPGGKLEAGESVAQCAIRETREEVGLTAQRPVCMLELRFVELDGPQWLGFAFRAGHYEGTLTASREADPFWCAHSDIPYAQMWPDDAIWLPRLLDAAAPPRPQVANFLFREGRLLAHEFVDEPSIWQDLRL